MTRRRSGTPRGPASISLTADFLPTVTPAGRGVRIDMTARDKDGERKTQVAVVTEPRGKRRKRR